MNEGPVYHFMLCYQYDLPAMQDHILLINAVHDHLHYHRRVI